jgi:hypothetical protein
MQESLFDRATALAAVQEFAALYRSRPLPTNPGGMGFNHSFATWFLLRVLAPEIVVESGVWRGHSTWLIETALPKARLFCFDPRPDRRLYTSRRATYATDDFSRFDWSQIDTRNAVVFCDDHQNCYERLKAGAWFGFRHFIFEDNFPLGEGDAYSPRHVRAGCGHPHLQMSRQYALRPRHLLNRILVEPLLHRLGNRQSAIVPPNTADAANLRARMAHYEEFPPVAIGDHTYWHTPWSGTYASEAPLFDNVSAAVAACGDQAREWNWDYGYLCYIRTT